MYAGENDGRTNITDSILSYNKFDTYKYHLQIRREGVCVNHVSQKSTNYVHMQNNRQKEHGIGHNHPTAEVGHPLNHVLGPADLV